VQATASKGWRGRTPFIGRARERSLITGELSRESVLLTITGPSGIGKTRLAKQIGVELLDAYQEDGGVWFCSLADCRTAAEVESGIARTLGIPQKSDADLASAISSRGRMLLILDNLDSAALQVGELLDDWLDSCPHLQLLTTSITPISVEGAIRIELGPLATSDAVALYLERAHRASADTLVAESDRPAVEELVRRLDGIPLAIELAAARVRVLPPKALLSRFGERFELLRSDAPGNTSTPSL